MATLALKKKDGSEAEVEASTEQLPPGEHGSRSLKGILLMSSQVGALDGSINPATGQPYVQILNRPRGGQVSLPAIPGARFDGRPITAPAR